MKFNVFEVPDKQNIFFSRKEKHGAHILIGTIDLDIQKPKKTVVKEAGGMRKECYGYDKVGVEWKLPAEAKNVKCTYEIEE